MQVQWIWPEAVGVWEIETTMGGVHRLVVPPGGAARIAELAGRGREPDGEPTELFAWGCYDKETGLASGVAVGERMVLVLEPADDGGDRVARLTQEVARIEVQADGDE